MDVFLCEAKSLRELYIYTHMIDIRQRVSWHPDCDYIQT